MPRDLSPPAFMFYPDDFASDGKVESMTTEGVGCYILLLCKAWRENPPATLPNDDRLLARWARVSDQRWTDLRVEVLSTFDTCDDGRLVQKRLRREYDKQASKRRQHSKSGKLGAASRWQLNGNANNDAMTTESENENGFEEFWESYPPGRKRSKGTAREAFLKAITKADAATITAAAKDYAASEVGRGQYVKMPATWLNQECWNDDRASWGNCEGPRPVPYRRISREEFSTLIADKQFVVLHKDKPDANGYYRAYGELKNGRKVESNNDPDWKP